jgi:hypothetical protein
MIKALLCFSQKGLVGLGAQPCARQQRFQPGGFRHRDPTDIEVVHDCSEAHKRAVFLQAETSHEHLEGDPCPSMGEGCAVEVKAQGVTGQSCGLSSQRNWALWSMNRRMSQAEARRSIQGRLRVAQIRP